MLRRTSQALVLLSFCLVAACRTVPNPAYCADNTDCQTPEHPDWVCGPMNACNAPPGASCDGDEDCPNDNESFCDTGQGMCRGCANSGECAERDVTAPICGANGACVSGCELSSECGDDRPYCNPGTGMCDPCVQERDDSVCFERDNDRPICGPAGTCVACLASADCGEANPVCDPDMNTCGPCQEHSDCAAFSGICGAEGKCVAESEVVYVSSGETSSDTGACDKQQPCATIPGARAKVDATKRYIRILDSEAYNGDFVLSNVTVSIIGDNASISGIRNSTAAIEIDANANVTLEGLTIRASGTDSDGILCTASSASVRLVNVTIQDSRGSGIEVSGCPLTVERSRITGNDGGGISVASAGFDITNSYIVDNGSATAEVGGVVIVNVNSRMPQRFAFNTVLDNVVGTGAAASGVSCTVPAADNGNGKLIATSNILRKDAGSQPPAVSGNCVWHNSNIEGGDTLGAIAALENANNYGDCGLVDKGSGVFAITAGSPCENTGEPGTGILVDYENASRSADTPDMGADEL